MRIYNYPGPKFTNLSDEEVKQILVSLEERLRSGRFTYSDIQFFREQATEIKEAWPKETVQKLREKSAKHPKDSNTDVIRSTIFEVLLETLVPKRAIGNNRMSLVAAEKSIATDLTLSCLFKHAPSLADAHEPRAFTPDGPLFMTKTVEKTGRVVLFEEDCKKPDIWIYAIYNHSLKRSVLLGWETKDGIRGKKRGNKSSNKEECPWVNMAYYFWFSEFKPMSELISKFGLEKIPALSLLESVPKEEDIPQEPVCDVNLVSEKTSEAGNEEAFFKDLLKAHPTSLALKKGP
jgi:hypothetical protein